MSRDNRRRLILQLATEPLCRDFQDTAVPPPRAVDPNGATQPIDRREAPTVRTRRVKDKDSETPPSGRYSHVFGRTR